MNKVRINLTKGIYQSMSQENRFKIKVILISPKGEEFECTNGKKFAETHNLNVGHLNAVIRGDEKQHKGWKLKEREAW